jgi:hypothetical protein
MIIRRKRTAKAPLAPAFSDSDRKLGELLSLTEQLLNGARRWANGEQIDSVLERIRRRAILIAHARYVELVPVYRQLALEQGLARSRDIDAFVNGTMVSDDIFKSYDPSWIEQSDYQSLNQWLRQRFSRVPQIDTAGISSVQDWKSRLKADEIYLLLSSGSTGNLSFIPRDRRTLDAMSRNGAMYPHSIWQPGPDGNLEPFDCLVLSNRGKTLGIQAGGEGLSRMAARSHFLFNSSPTAEPNDLGMDELYRQADGFLHRATADSRRVVVFGAPFQIAQFVAWSEANRSQITLPAESLVISGGGWKRFDDQRVSRQELLQRLDHVFGVPKSNCIDAYSTAEINSIFMTCREGRYHIPPLVEPVILDQRFAGQTGQSGHGILGILDPFAYSYPGFIITGDEVNLVKVGCECGLSGWAIEGEIHRASGQTAKGCGGVTAATLA